MSLEEERQPTLNPPFIISAVIFKSLQSGSTRLIISSLAYTITEDTQTCLAAHTANLMALHLQAHRYKEALRTPVKSKIDQLNLLEAAEWFSRPL